MKIENLDDCSVFSQRIAAMCDNALQGQQLVQQGAVHVVSFLLTHGCTEDNAVALLEQLRQNAALLRQESRRRGLHVLFEEDQTGFN